MITGRPPGPRTRQAAGGIFHLSRIVNYALCIAFTVFFHRKTAVVSGAAIVAFNFMPAGMPIRRGRNGCFNCNSGQRRPFAVHSGVRDLVPVPRKPGIDIAASFDDKGQHTVRRVFFRRKLGTRHAEPEFSWNRQIYCIFPSHAHVRKARRPPGYTPLHPRPDERSAYRLA